MNIISVGFSYLKKRSTKRSIMVNVSYVILLCLCTHLLSTSPAVSDATPCPANCSCANQSGRIVVNCTGLADLPSLNQLPAYLSILQIQKSEILQISSPLPYPSLVSLSLIDCKLSSFVDGTFRSLPFLQRLDLSNNRLNFSESFPTRPFVGLSSLTALSLKANLLANDTPADFFHGLTKLQRVDFDANIGIHFTSESAWTGLSITNVSCENCALKDLGGFLATAPKSIRMLKLRQNGLAAVPAGAFASFPSLQHLDLSECGIVSIGEKAFDGPTDLRTLNLSGNVLSEFSVSRGAFTRRAGGGRGRRGT